VRDFHGGLDVGTVAIDMTTPLQIAVHLRASTVAQGTIFVYYRRPGSTIWTEGPTTALWQPAAAAANMSQIIFGHHAVTTSVSHWTLFAWAFQGAIAFGEDKVAGKQVSDLPYPLIDAGTDGLAAFLSLRSGPGVRGEVYTIAAEADHGIVKAFPSVSPSRDEFWDSATDSAQKISVDMGFDTRLGQSFALVLAVLNSNVREIRLLGDIAGVPTLIGTWDGAAGFTGLSYTLSGDTLFPDVSAVPFIDGGRWIQAMEAVGGSVVLPAGKVRKILANSGGGWTKGGTVIPHFQLEGIDGTEAAGGLCDLVMPSGYMVCHLGTTANKFRRHFQIEISALQPTAEGRYQIGNLLLGGLVAMGKTWSNGWSLNTRPNYRARRDPYGTEYRQQRGPSSRVYSIAWPDGVKLHDLRGADLDVDYLGSSAVGATALVARDDVLYQLIGAMAESEGFSSPSLLLGEVPDASGVTITDPTLWAYGLLTGTVDAQNVAGVEGANEFYRISGIQLVEVR
jgi:hypothetical protein